ncbi:MAG: DUF1698 domain-containing protein [Candidatus Omnitrophica bacterium]|nr:DUF1698 domain-containing protein [Candidatus Omnitrophota bacterium]
MNADQLKAEVAKIRWWHTIDLGNGIITPGEDATAVKLKTIKMPEDLKGMSVLDIGAWDGFFSFEAERRGAARVLAVDSFCWSDKGWGRKAGFDLAKKALNSNVEDMFLEVLDITPAKTGMFDLVLFLGVLYHMRHPMLALEKAFSVTKKQLILETHVDMCAVPEPVMRFYACGELNNDVTSWWGPNPQAVLAMLGSVGFKTATIVYGPALLPASPGRGNVPLIRAVFHAFR